jgi:hypothetical protein
MLAPRKRVQSKRTYEYRTGGVPRQEDTGDEADDAGRYDFIEIGTSDFDTEIQTCPDSSRGLAVDALQLYLDRLPSKPNVTKVCAAVTGVVKEGAPTTMDVFYVEPDDIRKHGLPAWVRGCNSVEKPHPQAMHELRIRRVEHLCRRATVPVLSIEQLMDTYGVREVGYLKLDTEGHDCVILEGLVDACMKCPRRWPTSILFECNVLTNEADVNRTIQKLTDVGGYTLVSRTSDDVMMIRTERLERFDFIEIGTCDFDTIVQTCPETWRGLSVDAVHLYLDRLPDKANVTKVCCGVTGATKRADEQTEVFYIHPDDIARKKLPSWLRGCNSIKKPHPTALWKLRPATFWKLCRRAKVPLYSMEQLMNKYGVGSVDFLKIDAEGHDCNILEGLVRHCLLVPSRWPRRIQFECNFLTKPYSVDNIIRELVVNGNYTLISRTKDDCIVERDPTRVFLSHYHYRHGGTYDQLSKHTRDVYVRTDSVVETDIPCNLFQFWHGEMAPTMTHVTETLRAQNPEFTYRLFDQHTAEVFIRDHFHQRVVEAYRRLIPIAYKCDLFRYCVLYIHGGLYLDIGYECMNGFKLTDLLSGGWVLDKPGPFTTEHIGVFNGCIVCQSRCAILKRAIEMVVCNVEKQIMGHSTLYPTGPGLLGMAYEESQPHTAINMCLVADGTIVLPGGSMHPKTMKIIRNNTIILSRYNQYRSDQKTHGPLHYSLLWAQKAIYDTSPYTIDISTPFHIE